MADSEDQLSKRPSPSQPTTSRETSKRATEKRTPAASMVSKAAKSGQQSEVHHQLAKTAQKGTRPAQNPKKAAVSEEMDIDGDQLEEEEPEEMAEDSLSDDLEDEPEEMNKAASKAKKSQPNRTNKQRVQQAPQIDEENEVGEFADEDQPEANERELNQNNHMLQKSNQ